MSFTEKFMKLPQKLRMAIVGVVLVVLAVPAIGLLLLLKNVLPEGKPAAAATSTANTVAAEAPGKTKPKPAATTTTAKKK